MKVTVIVMDIITIVGIRHVDFTDDKGKQVAGYSLYYTMQADGVDGVMSGKMFVSDDKARTLTIPAVGSTVEVSYDRYGRASKFTVVK